jgi:hypothetical protein
VLAMTMANFMLVESKTYLGKCQLQNKKSYGTVFQNYFLKLVKNCLYLENIRKLQKNKIDLIIF